MSRPKSIHDTATELRTITGHYRCRVCKQPITPSMAWADFAAYQLYNAGTAALAWRVCGFRHMQCRDASEDEQKSADQQQNADDTQWQCTVCGRVGSVGRCCGLDTRKPLNDAARQEDQPTAND